MSKDRRLDRREFMRSAAALISLALPAELSARPIPTRPLGKTGVKVPIIALGGGSRLLSYTDSEAIAAVEEAISLGITYLDTAASYGAGRSERLIGRVLKERQSERGRLFIATKLLERSADAALRSFEASLKRLNVSQVDLLHIHDLKHEDDLAAIERRGGLLDALYRLREQKLARFIGITSHTDGKTMRLAIERHDIDCVQMALNPAGAGAFEQQALPAALERQLGIIAMKVTGQELLLAGSVRRDELARQLIRYALSLPVSCAVVGMPQRRMIRGNAALARSFIPLSEEELERLRMEFSGRRAGLERWLKGHDDCWSELA